MANTTAIASGVNRNLAAPVSSSTGTNTMQMESVETKAGTAICCAPSRIALRDRLPHPHIAMDILDFDRGVVHQNANRQRQPSERHGVHGFAQQTQNNERRQDGERNGDTDD